MPRAPRIDFPNALYHVISRGNGRADIFWDDDDRRRFLRQLADGLQTAGVLLYAYVLMDNHFHLLLRTPRANLSRFMQRLGTSFALYCRYKHRKPGHQLEGRFKAKLVEDETYLLALTRYIHLNPVKTAACRRLTKAARVRRLEAWPWSSYRGYVCTKHAADFVCYDLLNDYGRSLAVARRNYRAYTHAHVMDDDKPLLDAMRASRHALGSPDFIARTEKQLEGRRSGRVQDADLALPRPTVDIRRIDRLVAKRFGVEPADLKTHGQRCGPAKAAAIELACRLTGWTHRAIGAYYGGISGAAVSVARRRIRQGPPAQFHAITLIEKKLQS
ncbi:MAG: transposase [Pirellulales bacterium]|nr:transposase [Pirellulales bacterium]